MADAYQAKLTALRRDVETVIARLLVRQSEIEEFGRQLTILDSLHQEGGRVLEAAEALLANIRESSDTLQQVVPEP